MMELEPPLRPVNWPLGPRFCCRALALPPWLAISRCFLSSMPANPRSLETPCPPRLLAISSLHDVRPPRPTVGGMASFGRQRPQRPNRSVFSACRRVAPSAPGDGPTPVTKSDKPLQPTVDDG